MKIASFARRTPAGFLLVLAIGLAQPLFGQFVYVTTNYTLFAYSINNSTGALTSAPGAALSGASPHAVAVDPTGRFAYVVSGGQDVEALSISADGGLTLVGTYFTCEFAATALAIDPSGSFIYATCNNPGNAGTVVAYAIDAGTGERTPVPGSPFPPGVDPDAMAVDPTGKFLYVLNIGGPSISAYTINASTGALTAISGSPFDPGGYPDSMTVDPTGKFLYVGSGTAVVGGTGNVAAFTITSTGADARSRLAFCHHSRDWGCDIRRCRTYEQVSLCNAPQLHF